jgi:uncharacterized delta-60 repeat protein
MGYPVPSKTVRASRPPAAERLEPRALLASGGLDPSFSFDGRATSDFPSRGQGGSGGDMAVQADGKYVVAGGYADDVGVVRFNPDGSPDIAFGTGGRVRLDFNQGNSNDTEWAEAVAIAPDGKIVIAGSARTSSRDQFLVARLTPDGSLDPTFDGDGWRLIDFTIGSGRAHAVLVDGQGRITALGGSTPTIGGLGDMDWAMARLNPDGGMDTTFGPGGDGRRVQAATADGFSLVAVAGAAFDAQGRILATGSASTPHPTDPRRGVSVGAVARYLTDGTPDPSFGGGDGFAFAPGGADTEFQAANAVTPDAQGRIVLAGSAMLREPNRLEQDLAVWRFLPGGDLDPSFDGDGRATVGFLPRSSITSASTEWALAVTVAPDGRIVAAGNTRGGHNGNPEAVVALVRLDDAGRPDPSLDGDGRATGYLGFGVAAALLADGRIVAGSSWGFAVDRFTSDGAIDLTFANPYYLPGRAVSGFNESYPNVATAVAVQPDGGAVTAGFAQPPPGAGTYIVIARFMADGAADPAFRDYSITFDLADCMARAVAVQPDGRIVIGGYTHKPPRFGAEDDDFAIIRTTPNGGTDTTFGTNGFGAVRVSFGAAPESGRDRAYAMALLPDGRILLAGEADGNVALARLLPDGRLDPSFGVGGRVVTPANPTGASGATARATALALAADGSVVVAGPWGTPDPNGISPLETYQVLRYTPDGVLDSAFGAGGRVTGRFEESDGVVALALDRAGGIVVGGAAGQPRAAGEPPRGDDLDFALVRYRPDGSPDTAFGGGGTGRAGADLSGGGDDILRAMVIQPDGWIAAAGVAGADATSPEFGLARFTPQGAPDATFGDGGTVTTGFARAGTGVPSAGANALAMTPDGNKLVAAGSAVYTSGMPDFALARYDAPQRVRGRHVFYNNSAFDGNDPAADARDDGAIASDKRALLPGQAATFAHYTSFSNGINGVMVDIAGLPQDVTLSAVDFAFRVGNDNRPGAWATAPAPSAVNVHRGGGIGGSDRVTLTWPDGAIKKTWLQVTVKANASTGLPSPDVFYFGNAPGESGNWATAAVVNSVDESAARHRPRRAANPAPITYRWDYNRDGRVNRADQMVARANRTTALTALQLISVPAAPAAAMTITRGVPAGRQAFAADVTPRRLAAPSVFSRSRVEAGRPAEDLQDELG